MCERLKQRTVRRLAIVGPVVALLLVAAAPTARAQCPTVQTSESLASGTLTLSSASSFEMVFATDTGGGIREFYDLAATPVQNPSTDLAGSLAGNVPGLFNPGMSIAGPVFYNSSRNDQGARLELLEATSTRVRVRQEAFYADSVTGNILAGVKGVGDYSVSPCGKVGFHWTRTTTSPVTFNSEYHELVMHETAGAPLNGWTVFRESGGGPGAPGNDAFFLAHIDVGGAPAARTDFLDILHQDWSAADSLSWGTSAPNERLNAFWNDSTSTALATGATQSWNFLTYFKPTHFRDTNDPEVKGRRDDYHGPDAACINCGPDDLASPVPLAAGSGWFQASENTSSPSDFFNESEAAYALTLDPTNGLDWQIDGDATVAAERYTPFFKVRHWRSAFGLAQLSFTGARNAWQVEAQTGASEANNSNNGVLETHRALIQQAFLKRGGTQIRVRLRGHPTLTGATPLSNFHIAEVDPGDDRNVVDATWTQVTFSGGSTTVTVPAGSTVWSDWISFTIDPAKSYSLTFFLPVNSPSSEWIGSGIQKYLTVGADNSGVLDWSGIAPSTSSRIDFLEDVEVQFDGALTQGTDFLADVKPVARAFYSRDILWHSTLEDAAAVTGPDIGTAGTVNGATAFVAARYGGGAQFAAVADNVSFPGVGNLAVAAGTVEFWYQPTYNHDDGVAHRIWTYELDASNEMRLSKRAGTQLEFEILDNSVSTLVRVTSANYSWRANDWVHVRLTWANSGIQPTLGDQARVFINGVEPTHTDPVNPFNQVTLTNSGTVYIGSRAGFNASGIIDELRMYSGANRPGPMAHGGLISDTSENLATGTRNFTFDFTQVGGTSRGRYAHFGSDSTFRGLNVILQTAGAGTSPDLQWEYWNGTAWADLEAGFGFVDETNSLMANGSVYWTSDPTGWAPYSVGGSPDLYYVRAHLVGGDYATQFPTEFLITTDILLVQYCGDITDAAQRFVLAAPVPTAVELLSLEAVPSNASVDLAWRTGSELDNLGFHLYRSLSQDGLWTRITPSLIPGLGSSPEGASYSFRDTGLQNGTTYFYRLEDIDATSGYTYHGPVSATPSASAPGEEEEDGEEEDPEGSSDPDSSSGERTAYGAPGKPSLKVLSRNSRSMTLELTTPGFVATSTPAGVRVSARGFDSRRDPGAPALPLKRALVKAVVGRHARIVWARERDVLSFPNLTPAAVGAPEVFVAPDGTIQPRRRESPLEATEGVLPFSAVRIAGDAFIGKKKKLALEMSPIRYDASSGELLLARKLRVKIAFDRKARTGETGSGSEGRRRPGSANRGDAHVLAYLHTLSRGLHAVPYEALGLPGPIPRDSLRLSLQGQTVPHHVESRTRKFGPGAVLFFHGAQEASSMAFSSETTYALEKAKGGVAMKKAKASSSLKKLKKLSVAPLREARFETNRFYQAGLLNAPDIWLWDFMVGGMSKSQTFSVEGLDSSSSQQAHIQVVFQGASDAEIEDEHHLSVSLNGTPLGETSFDGKLAHVFSTSFSPSLLLEGENSLTVTNLGDTGAYSFVFLDRFSLVYPRTRALWAGRFEGVFSQKGKAVVSGGAAYGVDVTNPAAPLWLKLRKKKGRVQFKANAGHHYLLASKAGLLAPRVSKPLRTGLRSSWNQAEYVVIAPAAYLEAAQPLLERRQDQGLETKAVSFEEITSQFGYGRPSAEAIRDFLTYAFHNWQEPSLKYVVLLGDASYDPRNFTGRDKGAPLPALWAKTSYLWTSSDPTLGAVNGEDGLPDLAIGRLPATTVEEAQALIQKVLEWEATAQSLSGKAILVADNPDLAGDFEADIADIQASFLGGRETESILLRQHGANTRSEVLGALDGGASLLSYVGHGGPAVWASENVLNSWDPPKLLAQSEQPLMLTFNCLNGYFVAPNYDSLAEAFMKAEGRGTIGAFSPSGLSLDGPAHMFHKALMAEIVSGEHERLGDAVLAAQAAYAETGVMPELLAVYHLFGDPGMRIQ